MVSMLRRMYPILRTMVSKWNVSLSLSDCIFTLRACRSLENNTGNSSNHKVEKIIFLEIIET